jgi:membrane protein
LATAVDLKKKTGGGSGVAAEVSKAKRLIAALMAKKWVQHLKRAAARFGERLGSQFAAAITYFSFLALVPILMVSFSVAGFVLASRPDLIDQLQQQLTKQLPGPLSGNISDQLNSAVGARFSVGIIGLVLALYSGIGWMGNVRQAVQAQWRPDFDEDQEIANTSFLKNLWTNLWMLAGLGLALVVSIALSSIGNAFATEIVKALGLSDQGWLQPLISVVSIVLAIAADVLIFMWVYSTLPPHHMKGTRKALVRGSLIAAVGFEVLKFALTNILPAAISGGATGKVFGPIIGLLAFFNLVATLVLFVAAWISTADGGPRKKEADDDADRIQEPAVVVHEVVSRPKAGVLLGVGAVLGFGWSRRRR